jgi:hypothetical protein
MRDEILVQLEQVLLIYSAKHENHGEEIADLHRLSCVNRRADSLAYLSGDRFKLSPVGDDRSA